MNCFGDAVAYEHRYHVVGELAANLGASLPRLELGEDPFELAVVRDDDIDQVVRHVDPFVVSGPWAVPTP